MKFKELLKTGIISDCVIFECGYLTETDERRAEFYCTEINGDCFEDFAELSEMNVHCIFSNYDEYSFWDFPVVCYTKIVFDCYYDDLISRKYKEKHLVL